MQSLTVLGSHPLLTASLTSSNSPSLQALNSCLAISDDIAGDVQDIMGVSLSE